MKPEISPPRTPGHFTKILVRLYMQLSNSIAGNKQSQLKRRYVEFLI